MLEIPDKKPTLQGLVEARDKVLQYLDDLEGQIATEQRPKNLIECYHRMEPGDPGNTKPERGVKVILIDPMTSTVWAAYVMRRQDADNLQPHIDWLKDVPR